MTCRRLPFAPLTDTEVTISKPGKGGIAAPAGFGNTGSGGHRACRSSRPARVRRGWRRRLARPSPARLRRIAPSPDIAATNDRHRGWGRSSALRMRLFPAFDDAPHRAATVIDRPARHAPGEIDPNLPVAPAATVGELAVARGELFASRKAVGDQRLSCSGRLRAGGRPARIGIPSRRASGAQGRTMNSPAPPAPRRRYRERYICLRPPLRRSACSGNKPCHPCLQHVKRGDEMALRWRS